MRIGILVNAHRPDAIEAAAGTVRWLGERGVAAVSEPDTAPLIEVESVAPDGLADCDLVISFGGDGTLIRAAHLCSSRGTPILGVHYGRFGFVTQSRPSEIGAALSMFFDGQAKIQERMMVRADLMRHDRVVASLHSLNEAAMQRAATTRMLTFDVEVDGRPLMSYPADGVLVATPTGSTGYNLSANGPIVDPGVEGMILTPITAHTLSARSLVLKPSSTLLIRVETRGDAILSCDGQSRLQMLSGDSVRVQRSERVTRLVIIDEHDFYTKLTDRLFSRTLLPNSGQDGW